MHRFAPLLLLAALSALAQVPSPPQNTLTRTVSPDGGTLFYFADPRGLDTNTCTAAFTDGGKTGPCREITAVIGKLPRFIDHNVTITVDAGVYAPVIIDGFTTKSSATLLIQGAGVPLWSTFTPDAGTATGSLTAISAVSFPTKAILTDNTKTWHARTDRHSMRSMRGHYVCMTSGTAVNASRVIVDSSPTTLELPSTLTGAAPGDTYRLCNPSTVIRSTAANVDAIRFGNNVGNFTFNDLQLENISSGYGINTRATVRGLNAAVTVSRVRFAQSGSAFGAINPTATNPLTMALTDVSLTGSDDELGLISSNFPGVGGGVNLGRYTFSRAYMHCQRNCLTSNASVQTNGLSIDSDNVSAGNGPVFSVSGGLQSLSNGGAAEVIQLLWINCTSRLVSSSNNSEEGFTIGRGAFAIVNAISVDGCATGINVGGLGPFEEANVTLNLQGPAYLAVQKSSIQAATFSFTNLNPLASGASTGYGIRIGKGSTVDLAGSTVTFSNVNDAGRDYIFFDDQNFTEAQVQALPGKIKTVGNACLYR